MNKTETIPPPYEPEEGATAEKRLYSSEAVDAAAREAAEEEQEEGMPFFLFHPRRSFWEDD